MNKISTKTQKMVQAALHTGKLWITHLNFAAIVLEAQMSRIRMGYG